MRRRALRIVAGKLRPVGAIAATTTAMAPAPAVSETILAAVALIVAVRTGILLRLSAAAAGDECRQAAQFLSAAFVATLTRLLIRLLLMLRPVLPLLIARREWLGVAR